MADRQVICYTFSEWLADFLLKIFIESAANGDYVVMVEGPHDERLVQLFCQKLAEAWERIEYNRSVTLRLLHLYELDVQLVRTRTHELQAELDLLRIRELENELVKLQVRARLQRKRKADP